MITSRTEKELYLEYEDERNEALKDSSSFPQSGEYGLDDLGVGVEGEGVNDPDTYLIDSTPVDSETVPTPDAVDIRRMITPEAYSTSGE